jgi:hypothetical protein
VMSVATQKPRKRGSKGYIEKLRYGLAPKTIMIVTCAITHII